MLVTRWKGIGAETSTCPIRRSAHQAQLAQLTLSRRKRSFSVSHELPTVIGPRSRRIPPGSKVLESQTVKLPRPRIFYPRETEIFPSVMRARYPRAGRAAGRVGVEFAGAAHQLLRHTAVRAQAGCWALRRWRARRRVSGLARARSRRDRRDARGVSSPPPARSRRRRRRVGRDATAGRRKLTTRRPSRPGSASRRSCASWRPPTPERWPW